MVSPGGVVAMVMMFVAGRLVGKIQPKYLIAPGPWSSRCRCMR
jgi:DHA2 family multidrug resistance protein